MKEILFANNLFGIIISILTFYIGIKLFSKTRFPLFNPLLIAIILTSSFLLIFDIKTDYYLKGANLIAFFLGPATVVLAVPLFNQLELLKKHFIPVFAGIFFGSVTAILSVIFMAKFLDFDKKILLSVVPKSITTPLGIELSKTIGGIIPITVVCIVITGIFGAVALAPFLKLIKITNPIAQGVALGTAAHAVGTSKAVELGEVEGAMSSLSIGLAGIITVLVAPIILMYIR